MIQRRKFCVSRCTIPGIPSVSTQQATTTVLVPDGGTAFIGGILLDNDSVNISQIPGLGSIPVLGNLADRQEHERTIIRYYSAHQACEPVGVPVGATARRKVDNGLLGTGSRAVSGVDPEPTPPLIAVAHLSRRAGVRWFRSPKSESGQSLL